MPIGRLRQSCMMPRLCSSFVLQVVKEISIVNLQICFCPCKIVSTHLNYCKHQGHQKSERKLSPCMNKPVMYVDRLGSKLRLQDPETDDIPICLRALIVFNKDNTRKKFQLKVSSEFCRLLHILNSFWGAAHTQKIVKVLVLPISIFLLISDKFKRFNYKDHQDPGQFQLLHFILHFP